MPVDRRWWLPVRLATVSMVLTVALLCFVMGLQNAIITNTRGTFVYTVGPDGTAKVANVERLHAFGGDAAVRGLAGHEKVIVEGKQNLRPGGKVRIADMREPAARVAEQGKPKGGVE